MRIDEGTTAGLFRRISGRTPAYILGFLLIIGAVAIPNIASAQVLAFDRGLPTANLNPSSGLNQSNVLWADTETLPATPSLPGDDFTLPGTDTYTVTRIRVWSRANTGLVLVGGAAGQPKAQVSNTFTATAVKYQDGQDYIRSNNQSLQLYQIDFAVNIPITGGTKYEFFLDGPATVSGGQSTGVHLHASNAALSGSTQQGANDTFLFLDNAGTVLTWNSSGGGTYCGGCQGFASNTDANVQVFVTPAPVPTMTEWAMILFATILAGGAVLYIQRRRVEA